MKTVELFAGSGSFSKHIQSRGWNTYQIDNQQFKGTDWVTDLASIQPEEIQERIGGTPDVLWASPPCRWFSLNTAHQYWNPDLQPKKTEIDDWFLPDSEPPAIQGIRLVQHTQRIIEALQPRYWFVENPVGMLRKLPYMQWAPVRQTIDYCQYGDTRKKPTDIWSNLEWPARRRCRPNICGHERTDGNKGGTRGLANSYERAKIPEGLFWEIANWIEGREG
jgi:site-specific DNA-cytosine methylase